jgi:hypothetical protein
MSLLIELVAEFSPYIYAVCGLIALFQLYRTWQVRAERRQAVFVYEREKAVRELYSIFFAAIILLIVMGVTYFVSTTLARAVAPILAEARQPVPEPPFASLPTNTPLPVTPTNTPPFTATVAAVSLNVQIQEAVTPTPNSAVVTATTSIVLTAATPIRAVAPPTQPPLAGSCPDPQAQITSPINGQLVSDLITIQGAATHPSFQYYKIEYAPGANAQGGFSYLGGGNSQVIDGVLWSMDARSLSPGQWTLQLLVVDQTGNYLPPCKVTVIVQE